MKLKFNAPVTLIFSLICLVFLMLTPIVENLATQPVFGIFIHANWQHLFGNLMFLLLLGPIIEEKYGTLITSAMILFTAFITWFLNGLLFPGDIIIGASGIVFMFIMLAAITNIQGHQIPITLILVALLYMGQEIINSFQEDNISQFGHIAGGICGTIFGYVGNYIQRHKHSNE